MKIINTEKWGNGISRANIKQLPTKEDLLCM